MKWSARHSVEKGSVPRICFSYYCYYKCHWYFESGFLTSGAGSRSSSFTSAHYNAVSFGTVSDCSQFSVYEQAVAGSTCSVQFSSQLFATALFKHKLYTSNTPHKHECAVVGYGLGSAAGERYVGVARGSSARTLAWVLPY